MLHLVAKSVDIILKSYIENKMIAAQCCGLRFYTYMYKTVLLYRIKHLSIFISHLTAARIDWRALHHTSQVSTQPCISFIAIVYHIHTARQLTLCQQRPKIRHNASWAFSYSLFQNWWSINVVSQYHGDRTEWSSNVALWPSIKCNCSEFNYPSYEGMNTLNDSRMKTEMIQLKFSN